MDGNNDMKIAATGKRPNALGAPRRSVAIA
jgi:hypothetical protein